MSDRHALCTIHDNRTSCPRCAVNTVTSAAGHECSGPAGRRRLGVQTGLGEGVPGPPHLRPTLLPGSHGLPLPSCSVSSDPTRAWGLRIPTEVLSQSAHNRSESPITLWEGLFPSRNRQTLNTEDNDAERQRYSKERDTVPTPQTGDWNRRKGQKWTQVFMQLNR